MEKEVKKSFIEYSMSVIISRALPDVRDGMKPGQRRILYTMYEDGLTSAKPFHKSAATVGVVLARYHPHGDAAVYGTMVRMAQDFSYRYPLIEGHGNFGSVDGDPPAAYRYTEARMEKITDEMLRDIDKNVVPMMRNFDNRRDEPTVLPSRFPNLLVNGSVGIAVGMATNIPPHNLGEVIDATIYRMDHPDCTVPELMEYIKGPDFPTGAIIYGTAGIREAYTTGKGRITVRSRAEIDEEHNRIIITEIPYAVNKSTLCEAIANLHKEKKVEGITELRDESSSDAGTRIVIEYRRDANGQVLLNQLYKYSQLQDTFAANMLAIYHNEPKILSLPEILDLYIEHQESVITNRVKHDLDKALARVHILEGYKVANDNIDEVVQIMKTSESIPQSKERLMERFGLSDAQSQAIVEMTLGRLTGMERSKIEDELTKLEALITEYRAILGDINRVKQIVKDEMLEIKEKYGDERRTEISESENEIVLEDLIERHKCVVTLTHTGYIKRQPADSYTAQHRGGKGIIGMTTKEEDFIEKVIAVDSHSLLMMFTNLGKVHTVKAYMLPEAGRTAKGGHLANILELAEGEKVTAIISAANFSETEYLTMVTRQGVIKRTAMSEFAYQRKGGKIALTLDEGDELLYVVHTDGNGSLLLATAKGNAVKYDENTVRVMGRGARGVRGVRLDEDDVVVGAVFIDPKTDGDKLLMTVTEKGYGKKTSFEEFRLMKTRGGSGICCHKISERTGLLAGVASVSEEDDLMLITDQGTVIRTPVADINTYSRTAAGVIVMRLGEDAKIVNFTKLAPEEPEQGADEATEELITETVTPPTTEEEPIIPVLEDEQE
ncbi:MAG: DNA gyrase subunit A [Clostridia bacterium]|nr:DNA gyrase subunit A [Clostridia bacterium]